MRTTRALTLISAALATTVLLAGCGGSSHHGTSTGLSTDNQANAQKAANGGLGSQLQDMQQNTQKVCAAVSATDVQAVLKSPSAVTVQPLECDWNGGDLTVTLFPNDGNDKYYNDQAGFSPDAKNQTLSGIGDKAVWFQPVPGQTVPTVVSKKGTTTCLVQLSADPPDTTLAYGGSDPFWKITTADAAAYSAKLGRLCGDAFSALG